MLEAILVSLRLRFLLHYISLYVLEHPKSMILSQPIIISADAIPEILDFHSGFVLDKFSN